MSLHLLAGVTDERAKVLLAELSLDQLLGLVFAKAALDQKRVDIRVRPREARVKVKRVPPHYCPVSRVGECVFSVGEGVCLHCGRRPGEAHRG